MTVPTDGLQRMLDFLAFLQERNVHFFLSQYSPDGVTVTLTLVGSRIEAEFKVGHVEYCIFKGSEMVATDERELRRFIEQNSE